MSRMAQVTERLTSAAKFIQSTTGWRQYLAAEWQASRHKKKEKTALQKERTDPPRTSVWRDPSVQ